MPPSEFSLENTHADLSLSFPIFSHLPYFPTLGQWLFAVCAGVILELPGESQGGVERMLQKATPLARFWNESNEALEHRIQELEDGAHNLQVRCSDECEGCN